MCKKIIDQFQNFISQRQIWMVFALVLCLVRSKAASASLGLETSGTGTIKDQKMKENKDHPTGRAWVCNDTKLNLKVAYADNTSSWHICIFFFCWCCCFFFFKKMQTRFHGCTYPTCHTSWQLRIQEMVVPNRTFTNVKLWYPTALNAARRNVIAAARREASTEASKWNKRGKN